MEEEESLDCPVCFEQYDDTARAPKMMSCLHTVCASCVLDLLDLEGHHRGASEPEIPRGRKVTCPLCREEISTDKMQTNRYIVAHLHHLIRLGGLPNGETQHKTAAGTGTDRVKAMGVPVFPVMQQHPPRLAPAPPLPRRPTPPPPPRNPPPPPPQRTSPPQLEPRGVRRTSAPLPPSTAGEGERTPPAEGIVAKPPRPFPFGGPQKSPPLSAHPPRPLPSPPFPYPSPTTSYPPPPAYPSPPSSYPPPPSSYPPPPAYPSPPSSYPPPPPPPPFPSPSSFPPLPLCAPPYPAPYPPTPPSSVPPQDKQHPIYPTLSRFSDDSNDPSPRPPSVPTSPVDPSQDTVSPSAPPAVENLEEDLWCRTCDEPAKTFCINHELIPLLRGDEAAWIEEFQKRKHQEEQDLALALQLTEVALQDTPDSPSPATRSSVIVPVGRREGVWKGLASSRAKKIEVSKWTYVELRNAITTSSDPLLVKHCHKELQRRWKEYSRTMKRSKRRERKKLR